MSIFSAKIIARLAVGAGLLLLLSVVSAAVPSEGQAKTPPAPQLEQKLQSETPRLQPQWPPSNFEENELRPGRFGNGHPGQWCHATPGRPYHCHY